jgi:hypothetical protein
MSYKPYIQFHPRGVIHSCLRKIKLITPVESTSYGKTEICFCKVYTFQEYFEDKTPIIDRGVERMIAFGDIAQTLQCVDFVNNEIGLTYFLNNKNEHVIIAFHEINRKHIVYGIAGFCPATIREWDWMRSNATEKIQPLAKVEYIGHIRTISGIRGNHLRGLHSLQEIRKAQEQLNPNEFIELAVIKHYGPYKTYTWYHVGRHGWRQIS